MESAEVLDANMAFHSSDGVNDMNGHTSCGNGFEPKQAEIGDEHSDTLNVEFLDELDSMIEEDIDNRLTIARMVSDSMIKGMVSAVEQEAEDKIKTKDLELADLKRSLQFHNVNGDRNESCLLQETPEPTIEVSFKDTYVKHDHKLKESLVFLRSSATDQFKKLRKQIEGVKGSKIKRNGSCHEIVGLGGILKEEKYENGVSLEKTMDNLETVMNDTCTLINTMLVSKTPLSESQHEHELSRKLEDLVMQTSIRCIWDQEASSCKTQDIDLAEKFNNISALRNDIEALSKLLPHHESGNLVSHGSFDVDNTHGNSLRSQLSVEGLDVPDNFDAAQLSHLNKEQLVKFFNNTISKMKRDHESTVQKMTEDYISLKGKYLSERRSFVMPKEFETLKKKIPEVVSKLDDILSESDKFPGKSDSIASIDILNKTLNTLLRENNHLKDSLAANNNKVKHLESQLSSSGERFEKLAKTRESLMADACVEASIVEDVYKCVVEGLNCQIQDMKDESELEIITMHDIYEVLLGVGAKDSSVCAIEDTSMESLFMQELLQTVFEESLIDAEKKFETLHEEYITTNKKRARLVEEKERVERELTKEREQCKLALNECNNLRKQADWQETLMLKKNKEFDEMNDKFSKAQEKLLSEKMEINSLKEKVEVAMNEIKALNDYKNVVLDLSNEKQSFMSLIEVKEKEHRKQMEAIVVLVDELSTKIGDFERRVKWDILNNNTRLENSRSQLSSFIKEVSALKRMGILYKQKFETKCSDLQMAENEVDLLGDEVETLLGLLEKIYIALDHYSPVLQHYPGVIEILELVRRELSGESLKAH